MRFFQITLITLILLVPCVAKSQASLLERGQSGFGIQAGTTVGNGGMAVEGIAIGSFEGLFDLGAFVGIELQNERLRSEPAFGFAGEVIFLKENHKKKIPCSISIFGIHSIAENQESDTFGLALYKKFGKSNRGIFQPYFSVYRILLHSPRAESATAGSFGLNIGTVNSNAGLFNLSTSVSRLVGEYYYSISLGFIFGQFVPEKSKRNNFEF